MTISIRKLAALDLHFLGPTVILAEFGVGVIGPILLGAWTLHGARRHGWPAASTAFRIYLICLGVNYVPLLLHAVSVVHTGTIREEIAGELADCGRAMRKYRRQSLFLLVPLVVPVVALRQLRVRETEKV